MSDITIIDAPCGAGKTSFAIQYINENPNESFVFCTPYLTEIQRIISSCKNPNGTNRFYEPKQYETGRKIDGFNTLLDEGADIAVTHSTFLNATPDTLDFIRRGNYTLFVDEVLDTIIEFNDAQSVEESGGRQMIQKGDLDFLFQNNLIEVGHDYKVTWTGKDTEAGEHKFSKVRQYADLGRLYCVRNKLMMLVFPPEIFSCFKKVYLMTYLHDGTMFPSYLEYFRLPYGLATIQRDAENHYRLAEYSPTSDYEFRRRCCELIHICDNERLNGGYEKTSLSMSWFERQSKDKAVQNPQNKTLAQLKTDLAHFLTKCVPDAKASNGDIMWTAPKEYVGNLKGKGYTSIRALTREERTLPPERLNKLEMSLSCFVVQNARATNDYGKRWVLAYCVNKYYNRLTKGFFEDRNAERIDNGYLPLHLDEDKYALASLIQWVFRSRIRNGQPIWVYVPSSRMRELLKAWLVCKI